MTARRPIVSGTNRASAFTPEYRDTVFLVPDPPISWPPVFAIVTAHNPGGVVAHADANAAAGERLEALLFRESIASFLVVGASPDLGHQEAGHAIATDDLALVARISADMQQEAFFWIEDGDVFVCTDASGEGWRIGRWLDRVVREGPDR